MASGDKNDFEPVENDKRNHQENRQTSHEVVSGGRYGVPIQVAETAPVQQTQSVAIMSTIQQLALTGGEAALATIDKLVTLHERFAAAEAKRKFDEAFALAKGEITVLDKDAHVGYAAKAGAADKKDTDYDYTTMAEIYDKAVPALSKYGISHRFEIEQELIPLDNPGEYSQKITVTCIVTHHGGHSIKVKLWGGPDTSGNKPPHKAVNSALTILQTATLRTALGLASRKDKETADAATADANGGSGPEKLSEEQLIQIKLLAKEVEVNEAAFCKWASKAFGVAFGNYAEIHAQHFDRAVAALSKKKGETLRAQNQK
jgi:hypothetical protein